MAIDTGHVTRTTAAEFIPKLWSNEVLAAYKRNIVVRNLIKALPFKGKKGDTLYVPTFTRQSASAKAANTSVTLVAPTDTYVTISVNSHFEYSTLIEDIAEIQSLSSMRQTFTDDAGYALAKRVDQDLMWLSATLNDGTVSAAALFETAVIGSDGTTKFSGAANSNTGNGASLTDAGIRRMIQSLDDYDNPMDGRSLIIPPVERKTLMGIGRFTEQAFTGDGSPLKTGLLGSIYGIPVYVTTNCPWLHVNSVTGTQTGNFSSTNLSGTGATVQGFDASYNVDWNTSTPTDTQYRVGMLIHRDVMCLAEQMAVRTQTQYKQEYLGDLFTADTIYGFGLLRDSAVTGYGGVAFAVPA